MATKVRNNDPILSTVCTAFNALKVQIGAGANFHMDQSEVVVSAANASDLATSLTLCNELIAVMRFHFADTLSHKVADATSLPALGAGTDLAAAITAGNLMKASYNTHRASTTYHYNADATNVVAAVDATDQSSLNTLLNEIKVDLAAHMTSGPAAASLRLVSA